MKAKYIILSLIASLAVLVGCQKENPTYLDQVTVSSSYVSVPLAGGSNTITVDASSSWSISEIPQWLTVSPASGAAGQTTVSFSAEGVLDGREVTVKLVCDGATQLINVIQGVAVVSPATCAEVIAGPDKSYKVTGICTKIANTSYGNWYLNDGTGEIYIYGTVNEGGSYAWSSFNIEVGDEVTVQGPKTVYNGTVELVDATFISVSKSLIKVAEMDPEDGTIPTEGGELTVVLENKGNGIIVEVPEAAKSWLSIASVNGNTVTFNAAENVAGPRNATLVFQTTDGKKIYSAETSITQLGATGSKDLPFTVTEAIEYIQGLGEETAKDFYVKGIVSKIVNKFDAEYGNTTFWISEDGEYNDDLSLDFEGYRVLWLGNEKWEEGNAQIEVGAEVILCGKLTVYKGTAETSGNKAYIYQINGVTGEDDGIGTMESPFSAVGAIEAAKAAPASNVYVAGTISKIVDGGEFGSYGNATFWISEDGEYHSDLDLDFEAYRVLYLGNKKWAEGDTQIKVGDDVILYGQLTTYKGTSETVQNKAYIYSLNGKTE
ncbi:MAG: BACON domain-containing protein [Bacteroidales bacterium]|nr:BACON domain-containing protein [Bacteroidales bacterium]